MKKIAFIAGPISLSLTFLGMLFKTLHWPGADYLLLVGLLTLSLVFIPSIFKYWYDKESK